MFYLPSSLSQGRAQVKHTWKWDFILRKKLTFLCRSKVKTKYMLGNAVVPLLPETCCFVVGFIRTENEKFPRVSDPSNRPISQENQKGKFPSKLLTSPKHSGEGWCHLRDLELLHEDRSRTWGGHGKKVLDPGIKWATKWGPSSKGSIWKKNMKLLITNIYIRLFIHPHPFNYPPTSVKYLVGAS